MRRLFFNSGLGDCCIISLCCIPGARKSKTSQECTDQTAPDGSNSVTVPPPSRAETVENDELDLVDEGIEVDGGEIDESIQPQGDLIQEAPNLSGEVNKAHISLLMIAEKQKTSEIAFEKDDETSPTRPNPSLELSIGEDTIDETMDDIDHNALERQLSGRPVFDSKVDGNQKLLMSVVVSEDKKSISGILHEVEGLMRPENGGPKKIRIHVRILPSKRLLHKTKWYTVKDNKAVFTDEYKKSLDVTSNEKERILRMRVYGDKKCIGNGFVKIDDMAAGSSELLLIPLTQDENPE